MTFVPERPSTIRSVIMVVIVLTIAYTVFVEVLPAVQQSLAFHSTLPTPLDIVQVVGVITIIAFALVTLPRTFIGRIR